MQPALINQYIWFCAEWSPLHELKQPTIYNVINPFPWMDSILSPSKAKQTSLGNEWVNMQKVESILATSNKNVTCSLLMNSSS
jgi:hypothetical protein